MTISRRDFLKGTAGAVGAAAVTSPAAALGQSDSSVMDYIKEHFEYNPNNTYFTNQAIEWVKGDLEDKPEAAKSAIDGLKQYTDFQGPLTADDLPAIEKMAFPYGESPIEAFKDIHDRLGQPMPAGLMEEWLAHHVYDSSYPPREFPPYEHRGRPWLKGPQALSGEMESYDIQFPYRDLLNVVAKESHSHAVTPRPVDIDLDFIQELQERAEAGDRGLRTQDRPMFDRRYLYELLQTTNQEELIYDRETLVQEYGAILARPSVTGHPQSTSLVYLSPQDYNPPASRLSSTALAYITLADQLITQDTLDHLKELVLGDFEDKTTEWGGRVMIQDGRLHFQKDPLWKKEGNDRVFRSFPEYIAADFSAWHAHAIESLNLQGYARPSSKDLANLAEIGIPEFVVTPVGQQGDTLRMNIDMYQTARQCRPYQSDKNACPRPNERDALTPFVVDLGIFEA